MTTWNVRFIDPKAGGCSAQFTCTYMSDAERFCKNLFGQNITIVAITVAR